MHKLDLTGAVSALENSSLVVYPTDTLYALGADVFNEKAVRRVFEVKKRPWDIALPIAVSGVDDVEKIAVMNKHAKLLAEVFLPGPLTLILKKKKCVPDVVTGGLDKIAVRIPDNDFCLDLLTCFGPLTVTSANVHGMETPNNIEKIRTQFKTGDIAVFLDVGKLNGLPSTIVDTTSKKLKVVVKA